MLRAATHRAPTPYLGDPEAAGDRIPRVEVGEVLERLEAAGFRMTDRSRLSNDSGDVVRFAGGEVVCIYDSGKVVVQGKNPERVQEILDSEDAVLSRAGAGGGGRQVFVVYGHDDQARTELEAMLRRWQLEPIILDQLASEGATIIEKLERYATKDVAFAVVLATSVLDVFHDHRSDPLLAICSEDELRFRARQNVVLELGLLLAKLGRPKVAILLKKQEEMERPSDIQGLIYIPFTDNVEEAKLQLAKEMGKQGISLDVSRL